MTREDMLNEDLKNNVEDHIFASVIKSNVELQKDMISSYTKLLKNFFSNTDVEITLPLFIEVPHEKIIQCKFETTIYFKEFKFEKELCFKNGQASLEKDEILNIFREKVLLNLSLGEMPDSLLVKKRL